MSVSIQWENEWRRSLTGKKGSQAGSEFSEEVRAFALSGLSIAKFVSYSSIDSTNLTMGCLFSHAQTYMSRVLQSKVPPHPALSHLQVEIVNPSHVC
jgi:hypothetical protein